MLKYKKLLSVIIASFIVLSAAGCSGSKNKEQRSAGANTGQVSASPKAEGNSPKEAPAAPTPAEKQEAVKETAAPDTAKAPASSDNLGIQELMNKSKSIDNFSWEYSFDQEGQSNSTKFFVKGKKFKMEMSIAGEDDAQIAFYMDQEKNEAYMYQKAEKMAIKIKNLEQSQTQMIKPEDFLMQASSGDFEGFKSKGKETVNGKDCLVYEWSSADAQKVKVYIWDKYGVAVKCEVYNGADKVSFFEMKSFEVGNVTDEMVTLPKDIQIMELPQ